MTILSRVWHSTTELCNGSADRDFEGVWTRIGCGRRRLGRADQREGLEVESQVADICNKS